ncbi:response regulator transcription factor [Sphingomonas sp. KR1UV-12]|uniref:Response regulator transcription factor n=1 Tax=Sphingomonas aurea TaxID=3063994 RepID=A0ABT9EII1_9SPHN|nr:response regulator transcription factor [Sphingomonas sp. KR1UV-12]MDP1026775.1 response regulator transcription factor [Sphingomonas sp. KR1UV-12]
MNLLIVEDDEGYAEALRLELGALDHRISVATTGPAALTAVEQDDFDAIILDRMLPAMDGAGVVRRLRERGHRLPVLMLTALGRSAEKVDGLEAGADDYVVKPTPATEIDARLRALLRARGWADDSGDDTLRAGDILVSPGQHRAWRDGRVLDLAKLEFGLLTELARHAGSFLTRAMLIERVWGYDFEPTTNIVDAQVRSLRRKLMAVGGDDPIVTKRGVGYMLRT